MFKTLSAKYIKKIKKYYKKKFVKDIKIVLKKKKKKSNNMVMNFTKISHKIKTKLFEYRKKHYKMRKSAFL